MGAAASAHLNGTGAQLIRASKAGDADTVMELVSSHPQLLRYANYRQLGPCHFAARGDHVEVLQQLLAKAEEAEQLMRREAAAAGAKAHRPLHLGLHSFHAAAVRQQRQQPQAQAQQQEQAQQQPSLVQQLVNAASDRGVTPLMLAVDRGCTASVRLLLARGADPWAVDKLGGRTALHYAARSDNVELVQLLIDAAGDAGRVQFPNRANTRFVDVRTQAGFTAVHFAVQAGAQQALAVLLNCGSNLLLSSLFDCLDAINCPRGSTPLHLAARSGSVPVTQQLLKAYLETWHHRHMPDPRLLLDGDDQLPCQLAARRGHHELACMLLPSTPIPSLFGEGELTLLGPPSLAAIAGAVLRTTLAGDLSSVLQPQQAATCAAGAAAQDEPALECSTQPCARAAAADVADAGSPTAAAAEAASAAVAGGSLKVPDARCLKDLPCPGSFAGSATGSPLARSSTSSSCDDGLCGVCFDAHVQARLAPCGHKLCAACCQQLLALNSRCVMQCPFCRAGVARMEPCEEPPLLAAAGAAAEAPAAAAVVLA